jgi:hypothetical protein
MAFHNFATFVRQTDEKKAQNCANAILQQPSEGERINDCSS